MIMMIDVIIKNLIELLIYSIVKWLSKKNIKSNIINVYNGQGRHDWD